MPCCDWRDILWTPLRIWYCRLVEIITTVNAISRVHASFWRKMRSTLLERCEHLDGLVTYGRFTCSTQTLRGPTFSTVLSDIGVLSYIRDLMIVFFLLYFRLRCEYLIAFYGALLRTRCAIFSYLVYFHTKMLFHVPCSTHFTSTLYGAVANRSMPVQLVALWTYVVLSLNVIRLSIRLYIFWSTVFSPLTL